MSSRSEAGERVIAVVLTWNDVGNTGECVAGIERLTRRCERVVVVDNGSTEEIAARLRAAFPAHRVLRIPSNVGYTGGANRALAAALEEGAEWVLFLANDTVPEPEMLGRLLAAAADVPNAGLVGPRVMEYDSPDRLQHGAGFLKPVSGGPEIRDPDTPSRCDWVTGCGFLVRAEALRRMAPPMGFEEEFFCYWEDVDFSRRIAEAGYEVLYAPGAVRYHKESAEVSARSSAAKRHSRLSYMIRNRFLFARRHLPFAQRVVSFAQQICVEMPSVVAGSLRRNRGVSGGELGVILRGYLDGVRDRRGRARYSGLY